MDSEKKGQAVRGGKTMYNDDLQIIQALLHSILSAKKFFFSDVTPSVIDDLPGVYAIFDKTNGETLYVGRTTNLQQRLYRNHLMGPRSNARLKKYLMDDPNEPSIVTIEDAKEFLRERCYFQYVVEYDTSSRGRLEGLFSYLLNVRYISEEH